jgi:uncharacterized membrane protein YtjA (UPF0391 family)
VDGLNTPKFHTIPHFVAAFHHSNRGIAFLPEKVSNHLQNRKVMLRWSITFLIIALIAAVFGFGGIAAGAATFAKILFFIAIAVFVITLITGRKRIDI